MCASAPATGPGTRPNCCTARPQLPLAAIELACSGGFSALVPTRFVSRHLADGRLRTAAGCTVTMSEAHYLVHPSSRTALGTEATLFADWLRTLAE